ncbi:MAG TPA: hypothetical protein VGF48_01090 [Thermoanaerobaculia bacterium]|jgi:hypothetical protein
MRRTVVAASLLALALTLPSLAAPRVRNLANMKKGELTKIAAPAKAPTKLGQLPGKLNPVRANVISCESSEFAFVFPISGNVAGGFGTFFRTEITLINYLDTPQVIGVGWLALGQDNTDGDFEYFTMEAGEWASYPDFVGDVLDKTGLGAILIVAFDAQTGEVDEFAEIDGTSRIYTASNGGQASQTFPSVSVVDSVDDFTAVALGLRHGNGFRTNAGVLNLDSVQHTWTVFGGNGGEFTITVPPLSVVQAAVPANFPTSNGFLVLGFEPDASGFEWSAYASSNDNVTGDGWVSRATQ